MALALDSINLKRSDGYSSWLINQEVINHKSVMCDRLPLNVTHEVMLLW